MPSYTNLLCRRKSTMHYPRDTYVAGNPVVHHSAIIKDFGWLLSYHIIRAFLAVLEKRFGESELQDLLIKSRIVGSAVNGILQGKHYNRALRTHKVSIFLSLYTKTLV